MGGPSRRFLCLFRRETRQRIFGPEISPYPEVLRGRERELAGQRSWQAVDDGTRTRAVGDWTANWVGVEPWTDAVDSGDSTREERVQPRRRRLSQKMPAFQLLVEFSLVTHASVSPHMHVVLHTSFCSWLTPSFVRVCSSVLFSPVPPVVFLWWQAMCVTPLGPLVDHRPAVRSDMVRRKLTCVGARGRNVTLRKEFTNSNDQSK